MTDYAVIIAGDSNPLGYLNNGPAPYAPTYRVQIWTDTNGDGVADSWNYMDPGHNTGTPNNPTAWGAEVQLANDWLKADTNPGDILWIVKNAQTVHGGTTAGGDWDPQTGEMFASATQTINDAVHNLSGGPHQITQFNEALIGLGENDAVVPAYAQNYLAEITAINDAVRQQWHVQDLVEYRITTGAGDAAENLAVRQAQWQADQADPDLHTFKTIGFEMQPDGIHYDAVGHVQLGDADWANGWITL